MQWICEQSLLLMINQEANAQNIDSAYCIYMHAYIFVIFTYMCYMVSHGDLLIGLFKFSSCLLFK